MFLKLYGSFYKFGGPFCGRPFLISPSTLGTLGCMLGRLIFGNSHILDKDISDLYKKGLW